MRKKDQGLNFLTHLDLYQNLSRLLQNIWFRRSRRLRRQPAIFHFRQFSKQGPKFSYDYHQNGRPPKPFLGIAKYANNQRFSENVSEISQNVKMFKIFAQSDFCLRCFKFQKLQRLDFSESSKFSFALLDFEYRPAQTRAFCFRVYISDKKVFTSWETFGGKRQWDRFSVHWQLFLLLSMLTGKLAFRFQKKKQVWDFSQNMPSSLRRTIHL